MDFDETNQIGRLRAPPTYELVVDQLRRAFALGRFVPGSKLPPERELAEQLGVSRTTVREAIRILEGESVLRVRRGLTGGIFVCESPRTPPNYPELRKQAKAYEQVVDFRLFVERATANLAAKRRTKKHVKQLEQVIGELEDNAALLTEDLPEDDAARLSSEFTRLDTRLHLTVANASANPYLISAVETARIDMMRLIGSVFIRPLGDVNHRHRELAAAVIAREPDVAEREMAAHIETTRRQLRALTKARGGSQASPIAGRQSRSGR